MFPPQRERKKKERIYSKMKEDMKKMNKKSVIEGRSKNVANFIKLDEVMTMAL